VEYVITLGVKIKDIFNLDSFLELNLFLSFGIALILISYFFKWKWSPIVVYLGTLLYLYLGRPSLSEMARFFNAHFF
jgi:hypothetical protein